MKLAIFDFDGTLFPHDTIPFLLRQWAGQGYPLFRLIAVYASLGGLYVRYKLKLYGKLDIEQIKISAMQKATRLFDGMSAEQIRAFFEKSCKAILPHMNAKVMDEAHKAKAGGYHTVLLSGCYQMFLEMVAEAVGINAVIGTKLIFSGGRVDGAAPMDVVSGPAKGKRLCAAYGGTDIDWQDSLAYADSDSDLDILHMVGHPVAVAPDDGLKAAAEKNGWRVIA